MEPETGASLDAAPVLLALAGAVLVVETETLAAELVAPELPFDPLEVGAVGVGVTLALTLEGVLEAEAALSPEPATLTATNVTVVLATFAVDCPPSSSSWEAMQVAAPPLPNPHDWKTTAVAVMAPEPGTL